jgi:glycine/D-amino acid oxidase-like deaminating enzyme
MNHTCRIRPAHLKYFRCRCLDEDSRHPLAILEFFFKLSRTAQAPKDIAQHRFEAFLTSCRGKDSLIRSVPTPLKVSRRWFLRRCGALGGTSSLFGVPLLKNMVTNLDEKAFQAGKKLHAVVVGAGAFGGWTALFLLRRGARVTLIDAWGPGNSRASSGGETRVIRGTYGPNQPYTKMAARALNLWRENQQHWNRQLYRRLGVLWMIAQEDDQFEKGSLPMLREAGLAYEELKQTEIAKRYPQINVEDVKWAIFEPDGGALMARQACAAVLDAFLAEGGEYRQAAAQPPIISTGELKGIALSDSSTLIADRYVFACGPWLGKVFPDVIGDKIYPTRQEVFFFGTQAGDLRFNEEKMPVWIDHGARFYYGIPGNERRGFKLADDTRGPLFDPTDGERTPSAEALADARNHLAVRFPALKDAPVLEARICQYENSPDQNFIMDRHPRAANLWLVGGGSGHGFKHGPAVGEMVADLVATEKASDPLFSVSRFAPK